MPLYRAVRGAAGGVGLREGDEYVIECASVHLYITFFRRGVHTLRCQCF